MKTIKLQFKSNGKVVNKTAILTDDLKLSKSKRNQATDIVEYPEDCYWSIIFDESDTLQYEVEFGYRVYEKTLKPLKAITWENDVITDVQIARIR